MIASSEANALQCVPCIHYPVQFQGGQAVEIRALIDSGSKVNVITPAFVAKLILFIHPTGIGLQKIDGSARKTYSMGIAGFSIQDKSDRARFFEETFLLADTSIEVVLGMPFLALSNADIQFDTESFTWRSYSAAEALPTTRRVELIDKHEFAQAALDEKSETFVVYIAAMEVLDPALYPSRAPLLAALQQNKAPTEIPLEYADYTNVSSTDLAMELPENTGINKHDIELIEGKQPPYSPIYSLGLVELETLKAYVENHLKTRFIWPSKSPAGTPILFEKKLNSSLCLCVNY